MRGFRLLLDRLGRSYQRRLARWRHRGRAGGGVGGRERIDDGPAIARQALDLRLETDGGDAARRPVVCLGHALLLADERPEELRRVGAAHAVRDVVPSHQGPARPLLHIPGHFFISNVLLRARCSNCTPGDALDTCCSSPYGSDESDLPSLSARPSPDHAKGHRMSDIVGFIGLGTMGMPMTANLAKAGVALIVHDASPSATAAAGRLAGVNGAASASEVAA